MEKVSTKPQANVSSCAGNSTFLKCLRCFAALQGLYKTLKLIFMFDQGL
jgi:hypothetical protein